MRLDLTLIQIEALRNQLADEADDERLLADCIEGETDAHSVASRLVAAIEDEEGDQEALIAQIDTRNARLTRSRDRKARLRLALTMLVQATGLKKLSLPEATISIRDGKAKLAIVSEDAVPDAYQAVKRTPDKRAINDAFADADELPNWLVREPAQPSLTVRRA